MSHALHRSERSLRVSVDPQRDGHNLLSQPWRGLGPDRVLAAAALRVHGARRSGSAWRRRTTPATPSRTWSSNTWILTPLDRALRSTKDRGNASSFFFSRFLSHSRLNLQRRRGLVADDVSSDANPAEERLE
jgi:hypothetical protein